MLLPFWREVTFDFDSPKNHWLFSVSDDAMTLGTQNFKTSTLTRHIKSADHTRAIQAPKQRKEMKAAVEKALTKEEEVIMQFCGKNIWSKCCLIF